MAPRDDLQRSVGCGLTIDCQARIEVSIKEVSGGLRIAKPGILMVAIKGVLRSRRFPVNLMRNLLDVPSEKGFEQRQIPRIAPHALQVRTDPGGPMSLQHHAAIGFRIIEDFEQQILVAIGRMMLERLAVHPVGFAPNLFHYLEREKPAQQRIALRMQLLNEILHGPEWYQE